MIEVHRVRRLEYRLADYRGNLVAVLGHDAAQGIGISRIPCTASGDTRLLGEEMLRHDPLEEDVHPVRIRKRHAKRSVAVVSSLQGEKPVALRMAKRVMVLYGHLCGDLDRNRSGVSEEYTVESRRCDFCKPPGELHGRLMGKPSEHDVRQLLRLAAHGLDYSRMPMPVRHAPPT